MSSTVNDPIETPMNPAPVDQAPAENVEPARSSPAEAATLAPEQLEELKAKAAKADEHWERFLRTMAEMDNFKKRAARERQEITRLANEQLLTKLMPILDNFQMALAAAEGPNHSSVDALRDGVKMINSQFKAVLADAGLEEIDATGQMFDPLVHEAVAQHETAELPEGQVFQQLRPGYRYRERLLRPASVVVAKPPSVGEPQVPAV